MILDYCATILGSLLSFWNSRYLFRDCVQNLINNKPKLRAFSLALSKNSIKLVALLRISHLMPYHILNYTCGITTMRARDFTVGNLSAIVGHIPTIYILASISDVLSGEEALQVWVYLATAFGTVIMVFISYLIYKYTKTEIRREIEKTGVDREIDLEL